MAAFNQDTIKALKTKEDIDKLVATYPIKPSLEKKSVYSCFGTRR